MTDKVAIRVNKVSKSFILPHQKSNSIKNAFMGLFGLKSGRTLETQQALKDISFDIKEGEFFGIVGRNGSGKSTLLKILAKIYLPSSGGVEVNGKLVPFIELGVGFNPELTGRENVYLSASLMGFSRSETDEMYESIVEFAELERFMDQKLKNYSSGMQVRLAFSVAIRVESHILVLDEVLAVGDADFQRKCFNYFKTLKKQKKTVVLVTHDMNAVREYCDRVALIEKSKLAKIGDPEDVADSYIDLFQDNVRAADNTDKHASSSEIQMSNPTVTVSNESINFTVNIKSTKDVKQPLVGFKVRTADGVGLLGTNNKIKNKPINLLTKGSTISISWNFPNVLSDGSYNIDCSVLAADGVTVFDRWIDAVSFNVSKQEKTPYYFTPNIRLDIEESTAKKSE